MTPLKSESARAMKRTPMRRSAWPRKSQPEPQERAERPRPAYQPLAKLPNYGSPANDPVMARPKGEKTKPGKRTPTTAERAWMDKIVELGCICCRLEGKPPRPTTVHHILSGGRRIGHLHTIPLCDPGHHQNGQPFGLVSRHPDKARFEARFGTEQELLALVRKITGEST